MTLPSWASDPALSQEDRARAKMRFYVLLAALYDNDQASISDLARSISVSATTLYNGIEAGEFQPGTAALIEATAGRDVIRREDLCPRLSRA